jgi:hypothetical protein
MTEKQFIKSLSEIESLREHTVYDIIMSDGFLKNIGNRLEQQKQLRKAATNAIKSGRLPAHTVDRFLRHTAEEMRDEFLTAKTNKRGAAERKYIEQLGNLAYNDTIEEIAIAEKPELKEYFDKRRRNGRNS